ncbi:NAD(P)-dependent malic enzyme [Pseudothermotoga thermarum]|uniref:Malic protein NAD-binding protein n=1 Tax=Pseudothermotoga thermarum DSM 5069 TaxID=688269 RepID=F7YUH2_9THEM|nr:NADP-dependent malic enzyme [Pseudothermotoga thermarum]AEH51443.1 malic protein NAD-binding protein [Pseudothermotoga thermarum DSM 5069]
MLENNHVEKPQKTHEELSNKAKAFHSIYKGKVQIAPKVPILSYEDFAVWYTPGVAKVCQEIAKDKSRVYDYTNRENTIAVISDGTRILGLGDIGPEAGLPVIEGKALLFKYLGGVDAIPLCIGTKKLEEIVMFCKWISPSVAGINLEDIESPKCFLLLERLQEELSIPVFHDDQQGTATVTLAGLINALRIVGKDLYNVRIALIGAGSANYAFAKLLEKVGVDMSNVIVCDVKGIINKERLNEFAEPLKTMWSKTNGKNISGGIPEALKGADVCVAYSKSGPGIILKDWIKLMNKDAIVFAGANPVPEIWPWEAKEAGARIVATGRSDFPNQVNNSLGFPAIFRGVLDVRATKITDEMCIAAAQAIADYAYRKGIHEEYIVPTMEEKEVFIEEAFAVAKKAIEQGIAQNPLPDEELLKRIREKVEQGRMINEALIKGGIIKLPQLEGYHEK